MSYENKYLKYKTKYLRLMLVKQYGSGDEHLSLTDRCIVKIGEPPILFDANSRKVHEIWNKYVKLIPDLMVFLKKSDKLVLNIFDDEIEFPTRSKDESISAQEGAKNCCVHVFEFDDTSPYIRICDVLSKNKYCKTHLDFKKNNHDYYKYFCSQNTREFIEYLKANFRLDLQIIPLLICMLRRFVSYTFIFRDSEEEHERVLNMLSERLNEICDDVTFFLTQSPSTSPAAESTLQPPASPSKHQPPPVASSKPPPPPAASSVVTLTDLEFLEQEIKKVEQERRQIEESKPNLEKQLAKIEDNSQKIYLSQMLQILKVEPTNLICDSILALYTSETVHSTLVSAHFTRVLDLTITQATSALDGPRKPLKGKKTGKKTNPTNPEVLPINVLHLQHTIGLNLLDQFKNRLKEKLPLHDNLNCILADIMFNTKILKNNYELILLNFDVWYETYVIVEKLSQSLKGDSKTFFDGLTKELQILFIVEFLIFEIKKAKSEIKKAKSIEYVYKNIFKIISEGTDLPQITIDRQTETKYVYLIQFINGFRIGIETIFINYGILDRGLFLQKYLMTFIQFGANEAIARVPNEEELREILGEITAYS